MSFPAPEPRIRINASETLPDGLSNYLIAATNHMQQPRTRLNAVLLVLPDPPPRPGGAYINQDTAIFALDSICADSKGTYGLLEMIGSRRGVEPPPFLPAFRDISIGIADGIPIHIQPVLPPLELP